MMKKIYIVHTSNKVFHSERQAVEYCIKNDLMQDILTYIAYEYADYCNDILEDIDPVDRFNVMDSFLFNDVCRSLEL